MGRKTIGHINYAVEFSMLQPGCEFSNVMGFVMSAVLTPSIFL